LNFKDIKSNISTVNVSAMLHEQQFADQYV